VHFGCAFWFRYWDFREGLEIVLLICLGNSVCLLTYCAVAATWVTKPGETKNPRALISGTSFDSCNNTYKYFSCNMQSLATQETATNGRCLQTREAAQIWNLTLTTATGGSKITSTQCGFCWQSPSKQWNETAVFVTL